eukprot:m.256313 g.256313  ORF g.256313 m.256313 type:complete len:498 (-) comp17563_c0_seq3:4290-5783(-)
MLAVAHRARVLLQIHAKRSMAATIATEIPLVCVIGATGTGKTKLSVELAQHLNGEIISADSIQVYKGLDIASNKATVEEQQGIPHHLLDCLEPGYQLTMPEFRTRSIELISKMHQHHKTPIVVGGTHYYVEALMTLSASDKLAEQKPQPSSKSAVVWAHELSARPLNERTTDELYALLSKHDPASAARLHPNNRRKIHRSLEILLQTGVPQSSALETQQNHPVVLRYQPTICFWVDSTEDVLNERLSKRIAKMEAQGLQRELFQTLAKLVLTETPSQPQQLIDQAEQLDYTQGVLQAIGFKEYAPLFQHVLGLGWLEGLVSGSVLDWEQLDTLLQDEQATVLLQQGREAMDRATIKYAKRQLAWIKNRLLKARDGLYVYRVDSSEPDRWDELVSPLVLRILESFHQGTPMPGLPLEPERTKEEKQSEWKVHACTLCNRSFHGSTAYQAHVNSKGHRRKQAGLAKRKQQAANAEEVRNARRAKQAASASASPDGCPNG